MERMCWARGVQRIAPCRYWKTQRTKIRVFTEGKKYETMEQKPKGYRDLVGDLG